VALERFFLALFLFITSFNSQTDASAELSSQKPSTRCFERLLVSVLGPELDRLQKTYQYLEGEIDSIMAKESEFELVQTRRIVISNLSKGVSTAVMKLTEFRIYIRKMERTPLISTLDEAFHDLAGQLQVATLRLTLLEISPQSLEEGIRSGLKPLKVACGQARRIIENIKPVIDGFPAKSERADLNIKDVLEDLGTLIKGFPTSIRVRIAFPTSAIYSQANHSQLLRALVNLCNNAREALEDLGQEGNIWVSAYSLGHQVVLEVRDDGPGIPENLRLGIFSSRASVKGPGRGIGLVSSLAIAREHGGEMYLEPNRARSPGTTFRLLIPLFIPTEK
jgi:signal transduction histidine kinase